MSAWAARLKAPWWAVLLTLAGVGIGTTAGLWQLDRAGEKRELQARFAAGSSTTALHQLVSDGESTGLRYAQLRLTGHYDPDHQVLLDNLSYRGLPGYQVLTPLTTPVGTVLVNRGWVSANGDRTILPDIRVGNLAREVIGRIERLPRPGIQLAAAPMPADAAWPRRLLFPTSAEVSTQSGIALRDYQLLLDPGAADGFVRDWHPGGSMSPERHVAYAVQWFGLALTVVAIYVVLVLRNRKQAS